jgi:hypothetical protein
MANENAVGHEIMRLFKVSQENDDLLADALAGRERTASTVASLFGFITKHHRQDSRTVLEEMRTFPCGIRHKPETACEDSLSESSARRSEFCECPG